MSLGINIGLAIVGSDLAALRLCSYVEGRRLEFENHSLLVFSDSRLSPDVKSFLSLRGYKVIGVREFLNLRDVADLLLFSSFLATAELVRLNSKLNCVKLHLSLDGQRNVGTFIRSFGCKEVAVVSFFVVSPHLQMLERISRQGFSSITEVTVTSRDWVSTLDAYLGVGPTSDSPQSVHNGLLEASDLLMVYRPGWDRFGSSLDSQLESIIRVCKDKALNRLVIRGPRDSRSVISETTLTKLASELSGPEIQVIEWSTLVDSLDNPLLHQNPEFVAHQGYFGRPGGIFCYESSLPLSLSAVVPAVTLNFIQPAELACYTSLEPDFASETAEQSNWIFEMSKLLREYESEPMSSMRRPLLSSKVQESMDRTMELAPKLRAVPRSLLPAAWWALTSARAAMFWLKKLKVGD